MGRAKRNKKKKREQRAQPELPRGMKILLIEVEELVDFIKPSDMMYDVLKASISARLEMLRRHGIRWK